jgi:hypothetical protein
MGDAAETFEELVRRFGDSDDPRDSAAVEVAQQALVILRHRGDSRRFARELVSPFPGRLIRLESS